MADKSSLGLLGFIFGGVTATVAVIAGFLVISHLEGRLMLDEANAQTVSLVSNNR
jgi:hypothetical protein